MQFQGRRRWRGNIPLVDLKCARSFFFCFSIWLIFLILYLFLISLPKAFKWLSGWRAGCVPLGPGFDSQVPHIIVSIFSNMFICSKRQSVPPCTHQSQAPCVLKHQSSGQRVRNIIFPVKQVPRQFPKSTWLNEQMGLETASTPSDLAQTPPLGLHYFLFIFLSFNCFIYFYCFLINYSPTN